MLSDQTRRLAPEIVARYPKPRSALLPLLHLVQSDEGFVSPEGIALCAEVLGLTKAEVSAVSTFYTMYKRKPVGEYHVGVCTNTLCAVMGGDAIYDALKEHTGIKSQNGVSDDGKVSLEHIECNAACDFAPVVMVNWEFFDNQTPESARVLVDDLQSGRPVAPTRGASSVCTWKQASRILAGFGDGQATDGPQAGPASLVGLELAKEHGWTAPAPEHVSGEADQLAGAGSSAGSGPAGSGVSHADAANPRPGPSLGKESS